MHNAEVVYHGAQREIVLNNVTILDSGNYSCRVTYDGEDSTLSQNDNLDVIGMYVCIALV